MDGSEVVHFNDVVRALAIQDSGISGDAARHNPGLLDQRPQEQHQHRTTRSMTATANRKSNVSEPIEHESCGDVGFDDGQRSPSGASEQDGASGGAKMLIPKVSNCIAHRQLNWKCLCKGEFLRRASDEGDSIKRQRCSDLDEEQDTDEERKENLNSVRDSTDTRAEVSVRSIPNSGHDREQIVNDIERHKVSQWGGLERLTLTCGFFIADLSAILKLDILQIDSDAKYVSDPTSPLYGFRAPANTLEFCSLFAYLCLVMISTIHPQALPSDVGSIVSRATRARELMLYHDGISFPFFISKVLRPGGMATLGAILVGDDWLYKHFEWMGSRSKRPDVSRMAMFLSIKVIIVRSIFHLAQFLSKSGK